MADHEVDPLGLDESHEVTTRATHAQGVARTNRANRVNRRTRRAKLVGETPFEAHGKLRLELGAEMTPPGHRHEHRLDAAPQISARYVEDPHFKNSSRRYLASCSSSFP